MPWLKVSNCSLSIDGNASVPSELLLLTWTSLASTSDIFLSRSSAACSAGLTCSFGWKKLTVRWALFFLALAVINETVWRITSTATWVAFKVWGIIPLIFLFALAQTPLVMKHQAPEAASGEGAQE